VSDVAVWEFESKGNAAISRCVLRADIALEACGDRTGGRVDQADNAEPISQ
jgi:hypothetical protein